MIENQELQSPWLRANVAAKYLGIALGTLRNWTSDGFIPHVKRGHVVRYHREELDRWLAEAHNPGGKPGSDTSTASRPIDNV
jgi:excisionase family DNA binding protein